MALTATFLSGGMGSESRRSRRLSELWSITGDGAATTITITPRYIRKPKVVIGDVAYDVTTNPAQAALTVNTTLGSGAIIAVEIVGDLS